MSKGIITIASIIGALIIAGLLFMGINYGNSFGKEKLNTVQDMEHKQTLKEYTDMDGRDDIRGSEVLTFLSAHEGDEVCITVTTGKGTKNYNYKDKSLATKEDDTSKMITKAKKKTDAGYINPSGTFEASLEYDANKELCQITFKQK